MNGKNLLAAVLAALTLAGCAGGGERAQRRQSSAYWLPAGATIEFAQLAQLQSAGIGDLMVEAGRLGWNGSRPRIEKVATLELPRRTGVVLVVRGSWPTGELDATEAGTALAGGLVELAGRLRGSGLEALGVHLDVDAGASLGSYAKALAVAHKQLRGSPFLSCTIERSWLAKPEAMEVAKAVDQMVAFLYGQRGGEAEQEDAWDLQKVEANLRALEKWGRPYQIGVVTLNRALLVAGGKVRGETSRITLGELVRHPGLELEAGSFLEGVDRLLHSFSARGAVRVGEWSLQRGDRVRVVGMASYHLEELQRFLGALDLPHRLGLAYYRAPLPGEKLALSLDNLLNALDPSPAVAKPVVELLPVGGGGGGRLRYTLVIENRSDEPTDVILLGSNYVELRVDGGSVAKVDPGQFVRWELLTDDGNGGVMRAFRGAPIARLYTPLLAGHQAVKTGIIELAAPGGPASIRVGGEFVLPGGNTVAVELAQPASPP